MATTVARLQAVLSANTRDFDRAMDRSETRMGKLGSAAKVAGVAVAAGVAYGLEKSVHAAINAEKENARLGVAFRNAGLNAHRFSKQIEELESRNRKLGFTDEETKRSLGSLITVTHNYAKAVKEQSIAADLARFKGVSLEQATKALTMAHAGSLRPLKQLGLDVPKVTDAQDRLRFAVKNHTTEAYKNALANARVEDRATTLANVLKTVTQATHGQADAFAKTSAGGMEQFRAQVEHIEVAIGEKLLPTITMAIQYVMNHWPQISAAIQQSWDQIKPILTAFEDLIVALVGTIRRHWSTIGPIVMDVVNIVRTQLKILGDIIKLFTDILKGDWGAAWQDIKNIVSGVFKQIKNVITTEKDIVVGLVKGVGTAIWNGLKNAFNNAWDDVKGAVSGLFHKIVNWIKDFLGINSPSTVFHDIGVNMIKGLIKGVGSMAGALKHYVISTAEGALGHLNPFAGGHTQAPGSRQLGGTAGVTGGDVELGNRIIAAGVGSAHDHVVAQVAGAVGFAAKHGWHGRVNSAYRSYAEQAALYQRYLHGGPLAAKPGTSSHEKGEAVDVSDPGGFAAALRRAPGGEKIYNRLGSADPVHFSVSGYDKGGWLMPGATLAINNTGRPERVIPPGGGGDTYVLNFPGYLGNEKQLEGTIARIISKHGKRNAKFIGGDYRNNFLGNPGWSPG